MMRKFRCTQDYKSKAVFSDYIDFWYRIKTQAKGWPPHITEKTDPIEIKKLKAKYIKDVLLMDKVELDENEIVFNPGLYFVAKKFLNSLWGKLGQRPNLQKTSIVYSEKEFRVK